MERFLFIAADNGILSMRKKLFQRMVAIISRSLSSEAALMFFVLVACHIAKGGLLNVIGKEINSLKNNGIKSVYFDDTIC
jgi:hypothetical protein